MLTSGLLGPYFRRQEEEDMTLGLQRLLSNLPPDEREPALIAHYVVPENEETRH